MHVLCRESRSNCHESVHFQDLKVFLEMGFKESGARFTILLMDFNLDDCLLPEPHKDLVVEEVIIKACLLACL